MTQVPPFNLMVLWAQSAVIIRDNFPSLEHRKPKCPAWLHDLPEDIREHSNSWVNVLRSIYNSPLQQYAEMRAAKEYRTATAEFFDCLKAESEANRSEFLQSAVFKTNGMLESIICQIMLRNPEVARCKRVQVAPKLLRRINGYQNLRESIWGRRCQGLTRSGSQCSRTPKSNSSFCWQHDISREPLSSSRK